MPARTLSAAAITAALVLLPTAAYAAGPAVPASTTSEAAARVDVTDSAREPASIAGAADTAVVAGLVTLVAGSILLVLVRRGDDEESTD